jgi:hypothetical protein
MKRPDLARVAAVLGGIFVLVQLVPYGWSRTNPPVRAEPAWDAPRTRELFFRACADCHSNQTEWPWYSKIAPVSWLVVRDVEVGRSHFNVSEWDRPQEDAGEAAEEVRDGEMPLPIYLPAHPEARLSAAEKAELVRGLAATFGDEKRARDSRRGGDREGD